MENQTITPESVKKQIARTKLQAAKLEMMVNELDINLNKEMKQIFTALKIVKLKLSSIVHPDGGREKYRKLETKKECKRLNEYISITKREFFYASFDELKQALGKPLYNTKNSYFKWAYVSPAADIFTLYDYCIPNGIHVKTKGEIQNCKKFKWRIGAKSSADTDAFISWLQEKINGQA